LDERALVVIGGCGAVSSCALPLLFREFKFSKVVILDAKDLVTPLPTGTKFYKEFFTEENYKHILAKYFVAGDICCNLSIIESQAVLI
jgi:homospermidine synthase